MKGFYNFTLYSLEAHLHFKICGPRASLLVFYVLYKQIADFFAFEIEIVFTWSSINLKEHILIMILELRLIFYILGVQLGTRRFSIEVQKKLTTAAY